MTKKERLALFNKQNIIAAAKDLFQEKGVKDTTVDDIAKKAEYSKSTLYVYFRSKEEIYNYIISEYMSLLKDSLFEAIHMTSSVRDGYFAICNTLRQSYEAHPSYFDSILSEISVEPKDLMNDAILAKTFETGEEINLMMKEWIEQGIAQKEVRSDIDPFNTTFVLWISICSIISTANNKESYLQKVKNTSLQDFLQYSFEMLLSSIYIK